MFKKQIIPVKVRKIRKLNKREIQKKKSAKDGDPYTLRI